MKACGGCLAQVDPHECKDPGFGKILRGQCDSAQRTVVAMLRPLSVLILPEQHAASN